MTTLSPLMLPEATAGAGRQSAICRGPLARSLEGGYLDPVVRRAFDTAVDHVLPRRLKKRADVERLARALKSPEGFRAVAERSESTLAARLIRESEPNNVFPKTTTLALGAFPSVSHYLDTHGGGWVGTLAKLVDLAGFDIRHIDSSGVERILAQI